ncbi:sorting nexin-18-like [Xenopus laevis]|uniref:Sorting nexin-18-like n=1 Tax=Xenopus laevis TaxID=8355 RepID=A0A8J1M6A1_XENLA|nr:sorting nexin-18-like [Xenopus laevis]
MVCCEALTEALSYSYEGVSQKATTPAPTGGKKNSKEGDPDNPAQLSPEPLIPVWDDEWDDSSSTVAEEPAGPTCGSYSGGYHDYEGSGSSRFRLSTHSDLPPSPYSTSASIASSQAPGKGSATVSRNLNRFSVFVKSGWEAFVLGEAAGFVRDGDKLCLVQGPDGPEWQENPYPFCCNIDEPTKQTKFKGIKSYISYRLLPSHTGLQVHHHYKHFDWLYARLLYKFSVVSVPRIPEKQATGRFEEDFISKRRKGLVWWMDHMCSHPVLARCDAFQTGRKSPPVLSLALSCGDTGINCVQPGGHGDRDPESGLLL